MGGNCLFVKAGRSSGEPMDSRSHFRNVLVHCGRLEYVGRGDDSWLFVFDSLIWSDCIDLLGGGRSMEIIEILRAQANWLSSCG